MNIKAMRAKAGQAARLMKDLANGRRLLILCELLEGERSVGELEPVVGLSQSALSQHLAKLRHGKLVRTRREAQTIYYSLAHPAVTKVMSALYDVYCRPAAQK